MKLWVLIVFVGLALFCLFGGNATYCYSTRGTDVITVSNHDIKPLGGKSGGSLYMVFTKEGKTFIVSDNIWFFRFDSSDTYGALEIGKKYRIWTCGTRVHILSWYPNILRAEEIKPEAEPATSN